MHVLQHRPAPSRQDPMPLLPDAHAASYVSTRLSEPLHFSVDTRLSQQHLTRLDLCGKNLKRIDRLPNNIGFNVVLLDSNEISKLEHLDVLTQLIEVRSLFNQKSAQHPLV